MIDIDISKEDLLRQNDYQVRHATPRQQSKNSYISHYSKRAKIVTYAKSLESAFQIHNIKMIYDALLKISEEAAKLKFYFPANELFALTLPSLITTFLKKPYNEYIYYASLRCFASFSAYQRFSSSIDLTIAQFLLILLENPSVPPINPSNYVAFQFPFLLEQMNNIDIYNNVLLSISNIVKFNKPFRDFILSKNILQYLSKNILINHFPKTIKLSLSLIGNLFYLPLDVVDLDVSSYSSIFFHFLNNLSDVRYLFYCFYGIRQTCNQNLEYTSICLHQLANLSTFLFFNLNYSEKILNEVILLFISLLRYPQSYQFVLSHFSWEVFNEILISKKKVNKMMLCQLASIIVVADLDQANAASQRGTFELVINLMLNGTFEEKLSSTHLILVSAHNSTLFNSLMIDPFIPSLFSLIDTDDNECILEGLYFVSLLLKMKNNNCLMNKIESMIDLNALRNILERILLDDEKKNNQIIKVIEEFETAFDLNV